MEGSIQELRVDVAVPEAVISTEYLMAGNGPPVVFLHGIADSAHTWQWVMPILARSYRVFAPSLPGFGQSDKPAVPYSPEFFTKFVSAFLDALGLQRVCLVGNSLGGLVAMRLALSAPARVSALVLIGSAGLGRAVSMTMRLLSLPGVRKIATLWFRTAFGARVWVFQLSGLLIAQPQRSPLSWLEGLYQMARMPGYLEAVAATTVSAVNLRGQREILLDQLSKLTVPTLLLWGERDRMVPVRHAQAAVARLVQGQLEVLPDCGHLPQVEQPNRVTDVLSRFFEHADLS
ncbi:alpha/beta fold hydrolase [Methylocaldum sp.]|uniref:alpha/beta fold hydrolase n=1 Tax=Methylocaldum sp. TaxID=1969727 RepID=UPI002D247807|nr:alpha/beta fold hydrolase [Methylocaldum sp.]HYE34204.1 alpha/beta fold hydrolase [Methylocaldum sp.]